jgi:hypothetical protein
LLEWLFENISVSQFQKTPSDALLTDVEVSEWWHQIFIENFQHFNVLGQSFLCLAIVVKLDGAFEQRIGILIKI